MRDIKKRLEQKGWGKKDISKTVRIIEQAKAGKHPKIKILDKSVYWISLIVAIIGNLIISIAVIPELLALNSFQLYLVITILGVSFGLLFELLIRTIEHLKAKHHIFFGTVIPAIAVVNFFIVVLFSNRLVETIRVGNTHNPFFVAVVYSIAFILPYAIYQIFLKNKY